MEPETGGPGVETRSHLTIGEVLNLLKDEFPDITISKIRFLESQGLLEPERTPSGYRKFYQRDVERLRYILAEQKEKFLPLKVIRKQLVGSAGVPRRPAASEAMTEIEPAPEDLLVGSESDQTYGLEEIAGASGLDPSVISEIEDFGMLAPRHTADGRVYSEEDLSIARLARAFMRFGVEPRHLRMYKHFAEREGAVFEQIAGPMLKQKNPEARKLALNTLAELAALSRELKSVLLRAELRSIAGD